MRQIIIILVCAMIAPSAFAQTRSSKAQQTATTQPAAKTEATTTSIMGTVRIYQPGKTIVVDSTQGAVAFVPGTSMQIVNSAGNVVKSALKPGDNVRVDYTGTGENRTAERVFIEE